MAKTLGLPNMKTSRSRRWWNRILLRSLLPKRQLNQTGGCTLIVTLESSNVRQKLAYFLSQDQALPARCDCNKKRINNQNSCSNYNKKDEIQLNSIFKIRIYF